MKACALALFFLPVVLAADDSQLAAALKAQADFDRVDLKPRPRIPDAEACIQSQAAALAVSLPEELSLLHYRKGLCTFAVAATTRDTRQFLNAVAEFQKAIDAWPARTRKNSKRVAPDPVAPSLRVFHGIARLQAATEVADTAEARQEVTGALEAPGCDTNLMPATFCGELLAAGTQWLGWLALRDNQLDEAVRRFTAAPGAGWSVWALGRREFARANYAGAATQYAEAINQWKNIWQGEGPTLVNALAPRPQLATALADLGGARMLAGDLPGALLTLDASLQAEPANAHALYLRARAKELAGQKDAALADYNLASRTAFAAARDLASGEAHLYHGIVLFRRKDFARAEEEFASALNFEMTSDLRPDARAWRHLAAVAGGACGPARQSLSQALDTVSPYFPQAEARSLASACGTA